MSTTMMDALSNEASAVAELTKQAMGLLQEALAISASMSQQIDHLIVGGERLVGGDAEMISSFATVAEFQAFQARHFPFQALSPKASPGSYPAAQDDEQGNHGSAAANAASPGGTERTIEEVEQVVAEAAPGERFVGRDEPEAAPDAVSVKDRVLDLWSASTDGHTAIARLIGCPTSSVSNYLTQARRDGDRRAITGDVARADEAAKAEADDVAAQGAKPYDPPAADVNLPGEKKPGQMLHIDMSTRDVSLDGKTICVPRHDLRMLIAMNDGMPTGLETMLSAASVAQRRRLDTMVKSLSERIEVIGVEIIITDGPLYTLTHI